MVDEKAGFLSVKCPAIRSLDLHFPLGAQNDSMFPPPTLAPYVGPTPGWSLALAPTGHIKGPSQRQELPQFHDLGIVTEFDLT